MRRRDFIRAVGVTITARPLLARSQPLSPPRIGWISLASPEDAESSPFFDALRSGLRDLGYIEGDNLVIEARWARGDPERGAELTKELVRLRPTAIVSQGAAIRVVRPVVGQTPVVFAMSADPEKAGLVQSLARPGGNFTGATFMSYELNTKRLELIEELLPTASRVALLSNPEHPGEDGELEVSRQAAAALGVNLRYIPARSVRELEDAIVTMARHHPDALVALPDALVMQHRARLIEFATKQGIPAISGWSAFAR